MDPALRAELATLGPNDQVQAIVNFDPARTSGAVLASAIQNVGAGTVGFNNLDGGHIAISIVERIRGRAFSQLAYARYSAVGLTFFIFLLYLGLRNDFSSGHS